MGRMQIVLPDELETEFREEVSKNFGMKKGNISLAIIDAIREWIDSRKKKRKSAAEKAWQTRRNSN